MPGLVAAGLAWRATLWVRWRNQDATIDVIYGRLVRTAVIGAGLCSLLLLWSLALYSIGGSTQKGHVVVYIGLTAVAASCR